MKRQTLENAVAGPPLSTVGKFRGLAAITAGLTLTILGAGVLGDAVASLLLPHLSGQLGTTSTGATAVLVALLHAMVLAPVAVASRASGWRLAACLSAAYWLITWLLTVIEAVLFLGPILPAGFTAWTAVSQGLVAMAIGPMAVTLLSAGRPPVEKVRLHAPLLDRGVRPTAWGMRLGGISLLYLVAYMAAGIFIALRNPAIQEFYDALGMPSSSTMLIIQVGRSLLWAAAAALLLSVLDTKRRLAALMIGAVFSITMAADVLAPGPFMPAEIISTHFLEIASSNFLFGMAAAWILTRRSRRTIEAALP